MSIVERARSYVAAIPEAVSGHGGDRQTFKVALHLAQGFCLEEDDAWEILLEYNRRCRPPWSESDLSRKLECAIDTEIDEPGYLIDGQRKTPRSRATAQRIDRPVKLLPFDAEVGQAREEFEQIIAEHQASPDTWTSRSPVPLPKNPLDAWKSWMRLYNPEDVIWIGNRWDSGHPSCGSNFRTVDRWMARLTCGMYRAPIQIWGELTCPAVFKTDSLFRRKANIDHQPYLVLESDSLDKCQTTGLFLWLSEILRLRCVVDSGNKSLHGWFDMPDLMHVPLLKAVLTVMGCDRSMFTPSQPVRFPGGWRNGKKDNVQKMLYLDL
jgi:hypothetical protein